MYKNFTRPDSVRRQKEMVDCFARLLQTVPYEKLTVRRLCAEMNISRTVFYRYFESRNDLANALVDHLVLMLVADERALPSLLDENPDFLGWFRFWKSRMPLWQALQCSGLDSRLTAALLELVRREHLLPLQRKVGAVEFSLLQVRLHTVMYLIISMTAEWMRMGLAQPEEIMAGFCKEFLQRPLLQPQNGRGDRQGTKSTGTR